jgi:serine O-acetyltransferase
MASETWSLILSDVARITGRRSAADAIKQYVAGEAFRYNVWFRVVAGSSGGRLSPLRMAAQIMLRRQRYRLGVNLPGSTRVGPGLLIGHAGGIVVNAAATIGRNCNLSHNVTIGANKGRRAGVPSIGDDVYIGPGAVVIGNVSVGNGVAIGANSVVVDDVPAGVTVAGSPAKIVSPSGSEQWVNRKQ